MRRLDGGTETGARWGPGAWSLGMSLLAVAGVSMILVASMPGVDPPGWLRIVTIWMLPVGVAASLVTGAVGLVIRSGRRAALTGLAISALCVAAFVFIIATAEY